MAATTQSRFLTVVRAVVNRTFCVPHRAPFCFVPPKAKAIVNPLTIQFLLQTGVDGRGRKVMVADARQERYRKELEEEIGKLFRQYVEIVGGDPDSVPDQVVTWTSRPFGVEIPNPAKPLLYQWTPDLVGDLPRSGRNGVLLPFLPLGYAWTHGTKRLITWDRAADSHPLIAGTTGSGKSELIRSLLATLVEATSPEEAEIVLVDMKRRSLVAFEDAPHVRLPLAYTRENALAALCAIDRELTRRIAQGGQDRALFLVIDELTDLLDGDQQAQAWLTRLVQMGRELAMHVIAGTQKPLYGNIGQMKAQMTLRCVGRMASQRDATNVAEVEVDSHKFLHPGSFSVVSSTGRNVQIRALYADVSAIADVVRRAEDRFPAPSPTNLILPDAFSGSSRELARSAELDDQAERDLTILIETYGDPTAEKFSGKKLSRARLAETLAGEKVSGRKYYEYRERVDRALEKFSSRETA